MLKYKHMRLNQEKIDMARKILGAKTETETLNKALDKVIQEDQRRIRRTKIMQQMIELRNRSKQNEGGHIGVGANSEERKGEIL